MKYHLFVLQVNGDVTARRECDSQRAQSNPAARQLIQEFSTVLQERFAGKPEKAGKFWFRPVQKLSSRPSRTVVGQLESKSDGAYGAWRVLSKPDREAFLWRGRAVFARDSHIEPIEH